MVPNPFRGACRHVEVEDLRRKQHVTASGVKSRKVTDAPITRVRSRSTKGLKEVAEQHCRMRLGSLQAQEECCCNVLLANEMHRGRVWATGLKLYMGVCAKFFRSPMGSGGGMA